MRTRYLLIVPFTFFVSISFTQSSDIELCKTLLAQSELTEQEFGNLDELLFHINYYISNEPIEIYKQAIQKALDQENYRFAGRFEIKLADLFYELSEVDSCLARANHAAQFLLEHNEELEYARAANIRRLAYTEKNDYLSAYDIVFEAISIFEKYDDKVGRAITLRDIGSIMVHEKKYEDGIDYCMQAIPDLEEAKYWYELTFSYQRVAILNRLQGNYELAHDYILKAFEACRNLKGFRIDQGLAKKYWTRGYIYEAEEKYDQALAYYDSALVFSNNIGYTDMGISIKNYKGGILIHQGKFIQAIAELEEALSVWRSKNKIYDFYHPLYSNLIQAHEGLGNYEIANKYIKLISQAKDSIFRVEAEGQMVEMQTKYETTQKESTITLQEARLNQQKWVLILVGGILLISFIGGIVLFRLNRALQKRQEEKDFLMKEIHHRVKNNLQILSSLLSLQSDDEDNIAISGALQESRNRVESMGLIHQKLYTKDNLTAINMNEYVAELCEHLSDTFRSEEKEITISSDIRVGLADVETAIPLGLIINELITNSMKYAYQGSQSGTIKVKLWEENGEKLNLTVADQGQSNSENAKSGTHFGSRLIQILSKKLKGTISIHKDQGYHTLIVFERYRLS